MSAAQVIDLYSGYHPRPHQLAVSKALESHRFVVVVMHRRAGKTFGSIYELLEHALANPKPNARYAYIAPTFTQAKQIAWDGSTGLKNAARFVEGVLFNESELRCDLPNGARIKLGGAENDQGWRGLYHDGVVLDEVAQMPSHFWPEVIRPTLSDRQGWALFIGTPAGEDAFFDLYEHARSGEDPAWTALLFRWQDTDTLPLAEIESARRDMSPEQFAREYECAFSAGIEGSYYSRALDDAMNQGRIRSVLYDPRLKTYTGWDLGFGDATGIWVAQPAGGEIRVLRYYEDRNRKLGDYDAILRATGWNYTQDLLPHDVAQHELTLGRSREEVLRSLGRPVRVMPAVRKDDQIEAVRNFLPKCVFDKDGTEHGRRALRHFRVRPVSRGQLRTEGREPLHDWSSHAADAFAQLAIGMAEPRIAKRARVRPNTSWVV